MKKFITLLLLLIPFIASSQNCGIQKRVIKKILNDEYIKKDFVNFFKSRDTIGVSLGKRFPHKTDSFCNKQDSFQFGGRVVTFEKKGVCSELVFTEFETTDRIIFVVFNVLYPNYRYFKVYRNNNDLRLIFEGLRVAKLRDPEADCSGKTRYSRKAREKKSKR